MSIIKEEKKLMKYLKIEDNKVYFLKVNDKETKWETIDQLTKEDLLILLDKAIDVDFEMDEFIEANIANKAHQIIYKNIYEKLNDLINNKTKFLDECSSIYRNEIAEYTEETTK
jgi:predicted GTPase